MCDKHKDNDRECRYVPPDVRLLRLHLTKQEEKAKAYMIVCSKGSTKNSDS
jgi:hypothetical protein